MKILMIAALSAASFVPLASADASPAYKRGGAAALQALGGALYATVLTVTEAEARSLLIETDNDALHARLWSNRALLNSLANQGYGVEDVVGIAGRGASVTLYVR